MNSCLYCPSPSILLGLYHEERIILEVLYKMCLGSMFILIITLCFLHIFYETPDYNQILSFSFDEFTPITEDIIAIAYSVDK